MESTDYRNILIYYILCATDNMIIYIYIYTYNKNYESDWRICTSRKMLPRWVTHALLLPAHKIYTISLYLLNIFDILGLQYHHIQWINPYILSGSLINSRSYSFDTNVNTGLPLPPDHIYTISLYLLNIFDILGLQYHHIQWINPFIMSGSLINSRSYSFDTNVNTGLPLPPDHIYTISLYLLNIFDILGLQSEMGTKYFKCI